jgi:hypothetical protein
MSRHLLAPMPGIFDAFTGTRLNDPVSEVDITKYQQLINTTRRTSLARHSQAEARRRRWLR